MKQISAEENEIVCGSMNGFTKDTIKIREEIVIMWRDKKLEKMSAIEFVNWLQPLFSDFMAREKYRRLKLLRDGWDSDHSMINPMVEGSD